MAYSPKRLLYCPDCFAVMRPNGTTSAGYRRWRCRLCGKSKTAGPVRPFPPMRTDLKTIVQTIRHLVEGSSIRGTHRLLDVHQTTILRILARAGKRAERAMDKNMKRLKLAVIEADELWSFVHTTHRRLNQWHPEYGLQYVFVAFCPVTKLVVAHVVGRRNLNMAIKFFGILRRRIDCRVHR